MLYLQHRGFRYVEALVVALILMIAGAFAFELWLARPDWGAVAAGFVPTTAVLKDSGMLYIAIGILGATVMPHNLYLHSSIVQTRNYIDSEMSKREAIRFATIDSSVALMFALFINAAILMMAAATFYHTGHQDVADIGDAYKLLSPLLGSSVASAVFAFALLCSGQNATLTGTLAGQIVMEGFMNIRLRPWLRRLLTRLHRDRAGDHRRDAVRRARHGRAADSEPGRAQPAAAVCRDSARDVHERSPHDGAVRLAGLDAIARVARGGYHRRVERLAARPDVLVSSSMYRHILVAVENSGADRTILEHVSSSRS